ncbi:phospholipid/cholesterol/gamma-HCH transport system substrate-binding protein [Saccharopolyspora kobensis]|uniref:Phospholipid/cholesterol/gamma-HCH transport system substrate-binding protein n=1 Tax=Saccharopolyspora kobensis TaxID=146035 RepID=A0A1H6EF83_9PSEU|nr:MCE family protein [Saccharopolyspora kobensis]SEG96467.1 phospholipid/cholesterol/gamma-HCH transport system substrate-binding protein [Saccharopolyspora kobensis]SFF07398.1 phospholipid/cholesterol/gamma-HCH transport system substrate-binding protein [Saccharopolyspora kobensis]
MKRCALVVILLLVSGCSAGGFTGLYNAPLPGGAELGDRPYRVSAQFADVLDLVPQSSVKVNDVPVGRVERIELGPDNTTALVSMSVNGDVRLPANADARLRQSSLLGEKFIELAAPAQPASDELADGAVIPIERTNRNPQIEEVLGALSMLLNGGGVAQLQDIVREMNKVFTGNEAEIRSLLANLDETVSRLDGQREDITRAIDGLGRLSTTLREQTGTVSAALDDIGPGLQVLNEQRGQLVSMLESLDRLSGVAVDTVNRSRDDMLADLHALAPTLQKLADTGDALPDAIGFLATYPFPEYAMKPLKGDFVNADVRFDLDLSSIVENLSRSSGPLIPIPGLSDAGQSGLRPPPPAPPLPPLPLPVPGSAPTPSVPPLLGGQ